MLVAALGMFGLNMPVILAAFADNEFGSGVGGYSLFHSLTADRRAGRGDPVGPADATVRLRALVSTLTGLGVVLMVGALAPYSWLFAAMLVVHRAAHAALLDRRQLAGPDQRGAGGARPGDERLHLGAARRPGHRRTRRRVADRPLRRPAEHVPVRRAGRPVAVLTGLAMARQAHLRLEFDLHRDHGRSRCTSSALGPPELQHCGCLADLGGRSGRLRGDDDRMATWEDGPEYAPPSAPTASPTQLPPAEPSRPVSRAGRGPRSPNPPPGGTLETLVPPAEETRDPNIPFEVVASTMTAEPCRLRRAAPCAPPAEASRWASGTPASAEHRAGCHRPAAGHQRAIPWPAPAGPSVPALLPTVAGARPRRPTRTPARTGTPQPARYPAVPATPAPRPARWTRSG